MIKAKRSSTNKTISVSEAISYGYTDLTCPDCGIPVKVVGEQSVAVNPYFRQAYMDQPHNSSCLANIKHKDYEVFDEIQTIRPEEILARTLHSAARVRDVVEHRDGYQGKYTKNRLYLNTAKELFYYCVNHSPHHKLPGSNLLVGDVLIDYRNAAQIIGMLTGVKLFYGLTIRYCDTDLSITFKVTKYPDCEVIGRIFYEDTDIGKEQHFAMKQKIRRRSKKYTNKEKGIKAFAGVPIAAIGNWQRYKDNKSYISIENPNQIFYVR
jgi:hypothetical protein